MNIDQGIMMKVCRILEYFFFTFWIMIVAKVVFCVINMKHVFFHLRGVVRRVWTPMEKISSSAFAAVKIFLHESEPF